MLNGSSCYGASANNDVSAASDLGAETPLTRPVPPWKLGLRLIDDLP